MKHLAFLFFFTATAHAAAPLGTDKERDSYALGQDVAESIKRTDADLDINTLVQGIRDNLEGKPSLLSGPELTQARTRAQGTMLQNRTAKRAADSAKYGAAGQSFLATNKAQKGVVTTASGLQYQALTATTGPKPGPANRVVIDYKGTVVGGTGTEFDSSAAQGKPAVVGVSDGIAGWKEALQLMTIGSTYRFALPPQLAYGAQGLPGKVPPNATVVYEITLREVAK
ncbi:FKBP-type peptidyl-prolyl cis-trans isomerase [Corallococcus sp. AB030]|uniref:FKBP-type peptidyl-prolyl cis-trans isomerase N-terminal domain-containing protein n=1 Tax=Corallococcus TaxID=83461 RepID=UPI000EE2EF4B|nr:MULTISPECIES: FKBP-type peptidyl-prolyl cis-trans isomerase N-terminal domain-containing protein [Corallococcus]NRD58236.1 FKBP-type peptidyl-prolyl cis-trans isomerase [Corallococcus exiguus]RKH99109.1 FKBP-type peptidyl-prolyl cis-trans isomerase [Corallococcus sp. AB030]RUO87897.1 FKBP-type peptidyl-prolyl cis-trans isomerase [Corallococcus sp. AB018]